MSNCRAVAEGKAVSREAQRHRNSPLGAGRCVLNKFRPLQPWRQQDETVQRIEERECTEGSMPTARWSSPSRPQRAFAMVSSLTRNVSGFDVERHRNNGAPSSTTSSTRKPVKQLQQLLTDGRNRVCHSKRTVAVAPECGTPAAGFPANTDYQWANVRHRS